MNLLYKTRPYLVGPIESEVDCGQSWRNYLINELQECNFSWLNPCDKKFVKDTQETGDYQKRLKHLRENKQYDELSKEMKEIRIFDLSMVDRSDFIIFYFDDTKFTCGSWEELFAANSRKRPIFFVSKNGIDKVPLWMFGCIPYKYFYSSLNEAIKVIKDLDNGVKEMDSDRWRLFKKDFR